MLDDALLADYFAGALTPAQEAGVTASLATDEDAAREVARQRQLDAALRVLLAPSDRNARAAEAILADCAVAPSDFADRVCGTVITGRSQARQRRLAWVGLAAAAGIVALAVLWMSRQSVHDQAPAVVTAPPMASPQPSPRPAPTSGAIVQAPSSSAPTPFAVAQSTMPSKPVAPIPLQSSPKPLASVATRPMLSSTPAPSPTPAPPVVAAVTPRDPWQWPFATDSPWNTPLGEAAKLLPIDSPEFLRCRFSVEKQLIVRAQADDPEVRLGGRAQPALTLRWPTLPPSQPGDRRIAAVLSPDRAEALEFLAARSVRPQRVEVERYQRIDLRGPGFIGSGRALTESGASVLGGVIRPRELADGIRHAVALVVPATSVNRRAPNGRAFVWPATAADGDARQRYGTRGNLHLGSLLALPNVAEVARALELQGEPNRQLIRALRDYGAYVVGTHLDSAPFAFFVSEGAVVAPAEMSALLPQLRVVADNSAATPGGAGPRRQAPAPPLRDGPSAVPR